ncbi:MAG: right-handed parallel beta-helix repeat-containing protein, partial [Saccharofermentans sp.]|nr:right-handed parallel beta-helix repeat-containing protein [Saccharofermentans sp.]
CGDTGITAESCSGIDVVNTEIYECSSSAGLFRDTIRISFKDCNIHDIPNTDLFFIDCENVTWNGERHIGSYMLFEVKADGTLVPDKDSEEVAKITPPAEKAPATEASAA